MRALWVTMTSVGVMCLVMGLGSFVYGGWILEGTQSFRFGAMRGNWGQDEYAFVGTLVAGLGVGLVTAGVLGLRGDARREERWRWETEADGRRKADPAGPGQPPGPDRDGS